VNWHQVNWHRVSWPGEHLSQCVTLIPQQSVLKLNVGDRIRLSAAQFERLAKAFFAEIERKYL
jgi:hypothetical protein